MRPPVRTFEPDLQCGRVPDSPDNVLPVPEMILCHVAEDGMRGIGGNVVLFEQRWQC